MTKEILQNRLEMYLEAERAILAGAQEYEIGDRRLRRADLSKIRAAIDELQTQIKNLELKNGRIRRVIFID